MRDDWQTKKLGEVCKINMGQSPVSLTYNQKRIGLPFYQGKKDFGEINPTPRIWCSEPLKEVEKNDILISVRAPVGSLNIATEKSCIGRGLAGLRAKQAVLNQDFLLFFLKLKEKEISDKGTGSTFKAISKKDIEKIEIPLPYLSEQKEIVKVLDEKMKKIGEAKRLRADALADTEKVLFQTLAEIFEKGKEKGWKEKTIGDIFTFNYGKGLSRFERSQNGKYIAYGANGELGKTDKFLIEGDSIIIGRKGSAGEVIKVSGRFWPTDVTYFVVENPKYNINFAYYLFKYLKFTEYAKGVKPGINRNEIYSLKFYYPSLSEQQRIVAKLDALSACIRELRELQTSQLADLKSLERAYLREAFNGELI